MSSSHRARAQGANTRAQLKSWKAAQGIDSDSHVFTVPGSQGAVVSAALEERGWHRNTSLQAPDSFLCDLLWSQRREHCRSLRHHAGHSFHNSVLQNHFFQAQALTTKRGLCRTMQRCSNASLGSVDLSSIYPSSFDLKSQEDRETFVYQFMFWSAVSILKRYALHNPSGVSKSLLPSPEGIVSYSPPCPSVPLLLASGKVVLLHILHRDALRRPLPRWLSHHHTTETGAAVDEHNESDSHIPCPCTCWPALARQDVELVLGCSLASIGYRLVDQHGTLRERRVYETRSKGLQEQSPKSVDAVSGDAKVPNTFKSKAADAGSSIKDTQACPAGPVPPSPERAVCTASFGMLRGRQEQTRAQWVVDLLEAVQRENSQYNLCGYHSVWIVKPGNLSRGRSIRCFESLSKLWQYIQTKPNVADKQDQPLTMSDDEVFADSSSGQALGMSCNWVVQKYVDNVATIENRKFDIRQWVLVTGWNPLVVWFYEDCYVRFSTHDYDPNPNSLSNRFIHLTNNSVQKHSKRFQSSTFDGAMWHSSRMDRYLGKEDRKMELSWSHIKDAMKAAVTASVEAAQPSFLAAATQSPNSFELFGYDFVVDSTGQAWLIEVNRSPTMDTSTSVMQLLVPAMTRDMFKVVLDWKHNVFAQRFGRVRDLSGSHHQDRTFRQAVYPDQSPHPPSPRRRRKRAARGALTPQAIVRSADDVDTGKWSLLHVDVRNAVVPPTIRAFGSASALRCDGESLSATILHHFNLQAVVQRKSALRQRLASLRRQRRARERAADKESPASCGQGKQATSADSTQLRAGRVGVGRTQSPNSEHHSSTVESTSSPAGSGGGGTDAAPSTASTVTLLTPTRLRKGVTSRQQPERSLPSSNSTQPIRVPSLSPQATTLTVCKQSSSQSPTGDGAQATSHMETSSLTRTVQERGPPPHSKITETQQKHIARVRRCRSFLPTSSVRSSDTDAAPVPVQLLQLYKPRRRSHRRRRVCKVPLECNRRVGSSVSLSDLTAQTYRARQRKQHRKSTVSLPRVSRKTAHTMKAIVSVSSSVPSLLAASRRRIRVPLSPGCIFAAQCERK